jgi:hypothetical protein
MPLQSQEQASLEDLVWPHGLLGSIDALRMLALDRSIDGIQSLCLVPFSGPYPAVILPLLSILSINLIRHVLSPADRDLFFIRSLRDHDSVKSRPDRSRYVRWRGMNQFQLHLSLYPTMTAATHASNRHGSTPPEIPGARSNRERISPTSDRPLLRLHVPITNIPSTYTERDLHLRTLGNADLLETTELARRLLGRGRVCDVQLRDLCAVEGVGVLD